MNMKNDRKILMDFVDLVQFDQRQKCCVADATGVSVMRLEELAMGAEPTAQELLAICASAAYLEQVGCLNGHRAMEIATEWSKMHYTATLHKIYYLRNLMRGTGMLEQQTFLQTYHLFVDASSLCEDGMSLLLDWLLPDLKNLEPGHKINMPLVVIKSLQEKADVGLENLLRIQEADLLMTHGDEYDKSVISTFVSTFSKLKPDHGLVLLTNDTMLSKAVLMLNQIGIEGEEIIVAKLGSDGIPVLWNEPASVEATAKSVYHDEATVRVDRKHLPDKGAVDEGTVRYVAHTKKLDDMGPDDGGEAQEKLVAVWDLLDDDMDLDRMIAADSPMSQPMIPGDVMELPALDDLISNPVILGEVMDLPDLDGVKDVISEPIIPKEMGSVFDEDEEILDILGDEDDYYHIEDFDEDFDEESDEDKMERLILQDILGGLDTQEETEEADAGEDDGEYVEVEYE